MGAVGAIVVGGCWRFLEDTVESVSEKFASPFFTSSVESVLESSP
jgi:hypothetical protein